MKATKAETVKETMVVESIKHFATKNNFVQVAPTVRVNENGYPFLTFIDNNNKAQNVYFSRKAAQSIEAGKPVTKDMMSVYQIGYTKNEAGEERIKLISNSERISLNELF